MTTRRGVTGTGSVLDRIVADTVEPLEQRKLAEPEAALRQKFAALGEQIGARAALSAASLGANLVHVIAEIKKASPSKGVLAEKLDHRQIALEYTLGGASGISVVTEENYFQGRLEWLLDVRLFLQKRFQAARPTLLRKDFLFDPYQIVQSRAYGADNVLLIVAMLDDALLRDLLQQARGLDLDALVEVHNEAEAERAVAAGATLFGINNRDLHTFDVDLATTERVRPVLPADAIIVGESGVHTRADVKRLAKAGVRAILVGEAFMTAADIPAKMAELRI